MRRELTRRFPRAVLNARTARMSPEEARRFFGDADGAIVGLEPMTDDVLAACPRLRMLSKYGVGLDNIDQEACRRRGIRLGWTPGVNRLAVAELAVTFMLSLVRRVLPAAEELRRGRWARAAGRELTGKTVGVIGVGQIGREVIRLLRPFRCRILANDVVDRRAFYRSRGVTAASKERIYREADVVTLHVPLTPLTRGLIHRGVFSRMRRDAVLVNTARGAIVDQEALKDALSRGRIAGAALDVFEEEPPRDRALLRLPTLISTPHIGGRSEEGVLAMGRCAIAHLTRYFPGGRLSRR